LSPCKNTPYFNLLNWSVVTLFLIGIVSLYAPLERTLGAGAQMVYFHGAWVWTGKAAFGAAGLVGLVGLVFCREAWLKISRALGYTGLIFWLTYLPMSLWVQQTNWGGIYWDEPRWKVPLALGIAAVLLQGGLVLISDLRLTAGANFVFGAALWYFLGITQNVLHPDSPIFASESIRIQVFFVLLLVLSVAFGALLTRLFYQSKMLR
jgi:hypothetical protein